MVKSALFACLGLLCAAGAAQAQNPMTAALKSHHDMIKGNVTKAAAKMPEADYSFAPTKEVRTLGRVFAHIANANYMICSMAAGEKSPAAGDFEKTATTKAAIAKALDDSFAYCDGVYAKMTDTGGMATVKFFMGEQPKLAVLSFNNAHNMEHYGNLVTYMRIKGVVPPSSEGQ